MSWTIGYRIRCATYLVGLIVIVVMTHALGRLKCGVWTKLDLSEKGASENVMPTILACMPKLCHEVDRDEALAGLLELSTPN